MPAATRWTDGEGRLAAVIRSRGAAMWAYAQSLAGEAARDALEAAVASARLEIEAIERQHDVKAVLMRHVRHEVARRMPVPPTAGCASPSELALAWTPGQTGWTGRQRLGEHVRACARCTRVAGELRAADRLLNLRPTVPAPSWLYWALLSGDAAGPAGAVATNGDPVATGRPAGAPAVLVTAEIAAPRTEATPRQTSVAAAAIALVHAIARAVLSGPLILARGSARVARAAGVAVIALLTAAVRNGAAITRAGLVAGAGALTIGGRAVARSPGAIARVARRGGRRLAIGALVSLAATTVIAGAAVCVGGDRCGLPDVTGAPRIDDSALASGQPRAVSTATSADRAAAVAIASVIKQGSDVAGRTRERALAEELVRLRERRRVAAARRARERRRASARRRAADRRKRLVARKNATPRVVSRPPASRIPVRPVRRVAVAPRPTAAPRPVRRAKPRPKPKPQPPPDPVGRRPTQEAP